MPVPQKVLDLIAVFERNADEYRDSAFNEANLRQQFIDPMFKSLGWDMENEQGHAEAYKEVIHEASIKVGGATKAPDYCFRIGGVRKFFLEAKKPAVNIKNDPEPAYQLRRYAWSGRLPLSILTDFEEFAVYDCRVKPAASDKASAARIMYLTYTELADRWDEIAGIFSKDAILRGSFDNYAESTKGKKGTATVDAAFLQDIEGWRELLAKNLAMRNPRLGQRELNYAVQVTIDRIIFLRMCEDRGIERYGQLQALLNGSEVYGRLKELFRKADDRYNSGLFHFHRERERAEPDELTPALKIDDKALKDILKGLYYPDSPYVFAEIPTEILGQVYEQFLGKVIRLTAGHQAKVEDKPEVKKAGGVYYTPSYIVDYIVKHTIGKLLDDTTPKQAAKLRVLDPACGSGSFLLGGYQYLLDWHRDWYVHDGPEKHPKAIYAAPAGDWRLTTAERKRILLGNIYGVDIDPQAVEVTKLSLLLKVLEGESQASLDRQLRLFHERALPDLESNIKCGNSLIGPDFFNGQQRSMFDDEEQDRINVFDWHAGFPQIMKAGGFDAVIGNPPYLRIQGLRENYGDQIEYFARKYLSAVKRFDVYLLFIEKAFGLINRKGIVGLICPHKFLNSDFGSGLRQFLIDNLAIDSFLSFGNNFVFQQASTYTGILTLAREGESSFRYTRIADVPSRELPSQLGAVRNSDFIRYTFSSLTSKPWALTSSENKEVLAKLSLATSTVESVFQSVFQGVVTGVDELYFVKPLSLSGRIAHVSVLRDGREIKIERSILKPMLKGEDISRYCEPTAKLYCIFPYKLDRNKTVILDEQELIDNYPLAFRYLSEFKRELRDFRVKFKTNPKYWYSCHRGRSMADFAKARIVTQEISMGCNMTLDEEGLYHNTKVYSLLKASHVDESLLFWLGILNSRVMWWFLKNTGYVLRGGYFTFKTEYLNPFPLPRIDFSKRADKSRHDRMGKLVENMLALHKQLAAAKTPQQKAGLQNQIAATDRQIDGLVYELYGLTEQEIRIVEEAAGK